MAIPSNFIGAHVKLTDADLAAEAKALDVPLAILHAFSDVESGPGGGFLSTGEPVILFEARYFHLLTHGRYDLVAPNISSPTWNKALYGAGGVHQYTRLRSAMALDRVAALESCSIGRYQVMGANYASIGFNSIDEMWEAFCASEMAHLAAFSSFCVAHGLIRWMQTKPPDFVRLAVGYNGAGQRANGYATKLKNLYRFYSAQTQRRVPLRQVIDYPDFYPHALYPEEMEEYDA